MSLKKTAFIATLALALAPQLQAQAQAQGSLPTTGTMVIVPAFAEVMHANDQATATFMVEEQDKDKAAAPPGSIKR